jgi:hypothetical protein
VTAQDVRDLAGRLFRDELLSAAVVGPVERTADLERALRLP